MHYNCILQIRKCRLAKRPQRWDGWREELVTAQVSVPGGRDVKDVKYYTPFLQVKDHQLALVNLFIYFFFSKTTSSHLFWEFCLFFHPAPDFCQSVECMITSTYLSGVNRPLSLFFKINPLVFFLSFSYFILFHFLINGFQFFLRSLCTLWFSRFFFCLFFKDPFEFQFFYLLLFINLIKHYQYQFVHTFV